MYKYPIAEFSQPTEVEQRLNAALRRDGEDSEERKGER